MKCQLFLEPLFPFSLVRVRTTQWRKRKDQAKTRLSFKFSLFSRDNTDKNLKEKKINIYLSFSAVTYINSCRVKSALSNVVSLIGMNYTRAQAADIR